MIRCIYSALQLIDSNFADVEEICAEYNEVSLWWKNVRTTLTESTKSFNALTAALACRAISMTLEKYKEKLQNHKLSEANGNKREDVKNGNNVNEVDEIEKKSSDVTPDDETYSSISEWENVSNDTCQFTLLIGNLEDITILNAVIRCVLYLHYDRSLILNNKFFNFSQQVVSDETTQFFALPFIKYDISLASILSKGKGIFLFFQFNRFYLMYSSIFLFVSILFICSYQVLYLNWLQNG